MRIPIHSVCPADRIMLLIHLFIYNRVRFYTLMRYIKYGDNKSIQNWFLMLIPLFFLLQVTNEATFFDRNWTDHELHAAVLKESLCLFDGRGMFMKLDCRSLVILSAVIKTVGNTIQHSLSINTHNTKPPHVRCRNLQVTYSETFLKEEIPQDELAASQRNKQNRQCMYIHNIKAVRKTIFAVEKQ